MGKKCGFTKKLAEFITCDNASAFSENIIALSRQHILDTFAVGIAGLKTSAGKKICSYGRQLGGKPESSIIGIVQKISAETAALCNGTLSHSLDYDDDCVVTITHPSTVILPAVFALAEAENVQGRDVIEAYILGVETIAYLNKVMGIQHYLKGWHPTSTLGVMGATAACARLLKLDIDQTCHALAMAGSLACGSISNFGTMTKPLHAGNAARNGVMAARLAQNGFSSNGEMLEEPRFGYFSLFSGHETDLKLEWNPISPEKFHLLEPGINFKKYPCCAGMHATLDCCMHLAQEHRIDPEQVEKIEIVIEQMLMNTLDNPSPQNPNEARFSLQYAAAVMLVCQRAGIKEFLPETVLDTRIQNLAKRCCLIPKDGPPSGTYAVDARVSIIMKNDIRYEQVVEGFSGHATINPFTREDLVDKVRECCEFADISEKHDSLVTMILDRFTSDSDVSELAAWLRTV